MTVLAALKSFVEIQTFQYSTNCTMSISNRVTWSSWGRCNLWLLILYLSSLDSNFLSYLGVCLLKPAFTALFQKPDLTSVWWQSAPSPSRHPPRRTLPCPARAAASHHRWTERWCCFYDCSYFVHISCFTDKSFRLNHSSLSLVARINSWLRNSYLG